MTKYPRAGAALLHGTSVRRSFPHIHRRVHGDVLGHHLGVNGVEAFAANLGEAFDLDLGDGVKITLVALAFIT